MEVTIESLQRRDRRAWRAVYDDNVDAVYGYAFYRTRGNRSVAEEVTQETFTRAIESIGSFRGDPANLAPWLRGIERRVLARRARSLAPVAARPLPLDTLEGGNGWVLVCPDDRPDAVLQREEERNLTGAALSALPTRWEGVLRLKYCEELRVAEIAEQFTTTVKAVESLLSRARAAFRETYSRMAKLDGRLHEAQDWSDE